MSSVAFSADALVASARDLIAQSRDVEATEILAASLGQSNDPRRIAALLAEAARAAPQPTARLVAARALMDVLPDVADAWRQLGQIAFEANDFSAAAGAYERASERFGGDDHDRLTAGMTAYLGNDLDSAARFYSRVRSPTPAAHRGLADIAVARGDRVEAEQRLRAGLAVSPDDVFLLAGLADLGFVDDTRPGLDSAARRQDLPVEVRAAAAFGMAAIASREADPRSAMCWAGYANRLSREGMPAYRPEHEEAALARMLELDDAMGPLPSAQDDELRPIVIVGTPRSGTSIVESLLAAHPSVSAGGERMDLAMAGREIEIVASSRGVSVAQSVFAARRQGLRDWVAARVQRAGLNRKHYTDKLPQNVINVGLIARLFPAARIVFMRRDPREVVVSMYLLNFAAAYPYATDLEDLIHAMRLADRALVEWKARLGDRLVVVEHEAFCADPARQGQRLFDFCGLDWSPDYLRPERRTAPMRTFSALQVRGAIAPRPPRWPLYQPWIGPVIAAFGSYDRPRRGYEDEPEPLIAALAPWSVRGPDGPTSSLN